MQLKSIVQPKEWVLSIINLVYLHKIRAEVEDYKEGNPVKSMRDFLSEFFLVRFGVKRIAESLLNDFVSQLYLSLKKNFETHQPAHERYRTFLTFCGIHVYKGAAKMPVRKKDFLFEK